MQCWLGPGRELARDGVPPLAMPGLSGSDHGSGGFSVVVLEQPAEALLAEDSSLVGRIGVGKLSSAADCVVRGHGASRNQRRFRSQEHKLH
jgi:hypothetical protein